MPAGPFQMDQPAVSPAESRERAGSSDPCSTRPNPFDDDDGSSARKRRRTSLNGASPSHSVETPPESPPVDTQSRGEEKAAEKAAEEAADSDAIMTMDSASSEPQTPERQQEQRHPGSETKPTKITLNLKAAKQTPHHGPSSPMSPSVMDEDLVALQNGIRASVEDCDADHTVPGFVDAVSPRLDTDDPPIEIVDNDEAEQSGAAHVTLDMRNPMIQFPGSLGEPVVDSLPKLCAVLPTNQQAVLYMRDWLDSYIVWSRDQDIPILQANFTEYREFWQLLPQLLWQYSAPTRNPLVRNAQLHQLFCDLHTSFARLTSLLIDLDRAQVLKAVGNKEWDEPLSTQYAHHLQLLLFDYAQAFLPNMYVMDLEAPWPDILRHLLEGFRSFRHTSMSQPPVNSLYHIGFTLAELVPRFPRALESLAGIVQLASLLARDDSARLRTSAFDPGSDTAKSIASQGYDLYAAVAGALEICIDKSVNQIAPNTASELLNGLTDILRLSLRGESERTREVIKIHQQEHPELPSTETVKVIVSEWRLATLTKLIMSSQMQLRILAAQVMCGDLVQIWKEYHEQAIDLSQQPVLRHFSRQLEQSKVVSYVLGPTCHPEVTTQSYNIIGFLFASHTFTENQMDEMWRTITTCQISGVSESLLMMIANISNLFSMDDFLCVFRKMQTVQIENFNTTMMECCDLVLRNLVNRNDIIQDLLPYSFVFRMLRESSAPGPRSYRTIQRWASVHIPPLLRNGPSQEDRQLLIQECLKDIAARSSYTLGSLHGLLLLCRPGSRERDLQQLASQYNLPQLLVDELEHVVGSREETGVSHLISGSENNPRLELLTNVILLKRDSGAIPEKLSRRLWDLLVGPHAASQEDRDCAWQSLSDAMKNSSGTSFLETCFNDYLPTLSPSLFRPGTLDFILQRILPLINSDNSFILEDRDSKSHLGIEQLWRVALTAPSGTIERRAITALVKDVYLDNRSIQLMPVHRVRKIHLALVNRCMQQLSSAAKQLTADDEGKVADVNAMVISNNDRSLPEQELLFTRSLTIVREFHSNHQLTPRFSSPDLRSLVLPASNDVEGDSAELKFQSFDGDTQTDVKALPIGRQNTAGSLLASIRDATGFDNYRLYYKGRPFTPSEQDICKSLEVLQIHNGLILVKRETDAEECPVHVRPGASPVEIEIMKHFEELWRYLALKETLASEIYAFLVTLPVGDRILKMVADEGVSCGDIFPTGHPLKSLYAIHALREHLNAELSQTKSSLEVARYENALRRAFSLVVSAISDRDVIDNVSGDDMRVTLASKLVQQFLAILKDPMRPVSTNESLDQVLVERLVEMLVSSLKADPTPIVNALITNALRAIMDTCSLKWDLWESLQSKINLQQTVQRLLIDDARDDVRKVTAAIFGDKIVRNLGPSAVPATTFRDLFLPMLIDLVPRALARPARSLEIFNLLVTLLRSAGEAASPGLDLRETARRLNDLLIGYSPSESAGMALALPRRPAENPLPSQEIQPGSIDLGAFGLVNLLHRLLCNNDDEGVSDVLDFGSGSELFWRRLFPRSWESPDLLWNGGLIYNEATRFRLNDIVLKLVGRDLQQLKQFFGDLSLLVPCSAEDQADERTYRYVLPFGFDRSKEIRAACGYAGLRNLSNTCYLNSLCTQLFMNPEFRQFMLAVPVDKRDYSQILLWETQSLFGQLQSSHQRFVDPESFVASIKTYDDDMINIHHQMDVEEFFNLLNDRWEGQLRSSDAVRRFRSFYGGQLVTQTKSKECDHISEVMEPFSAIQCDIKGKKNLLESLSAYVDGEHMEGDNKYKCSSCDRHVDAVRRSCLKEIPDSLIFHLKRFDFNLRTQSRSKINDHFSFPERINMRPYTVEHLSNSPGGSSEDWFELVGVLVHAGTAESGHYYSFIRERPTSRKDESWFEFNDDVVSPWHPSRMEACCFGGTESSWDAGGVTYEKNYCAYMLFYERSSTLEKKQRELQQLRQKSPVQARMSTSLASYVREENLRILQRHCLFDPDHIRLVDSAIERMLDLNDSQCSEDHKIEKLAIETAIAHLDQVASRVKDVPEVQKLADRIRGMVDSCANCALAAYEYLSDRPEAFRSLVQRNPDAVVRRCAADILIEALQSIKSTYPGHYCHAGQPTEEYQDDVVNGACALFEQLWESFHYPNSYRSWPEFFELMTRFVCSGKDELVAFLTRRFLSKTLLVFIAEYLEEDKRDAQFSKMCNILARRPNRMPSYESAIDLLRCILIEVTPFQPVRDELNRERMFVAHRDEPVRLTLVELRLLDQTLEVGGNALLDKVITLNQNPDATENIVAHVLAQEWPLEEDLLDTLLFNTTPQNSYMPYAPYLRAATVFCIHSHSAERIDKLIGHIAEQSVILARSEPKAVWKFFKETIQEDREFSGESKAKIHLQFLKYLPVWAPALLAQYDPALSLQVENYLHDCIFKFSADEETADEEGGDEGAQAITECARKLGTQLCEYINEACIQGNQTVSSQTVSLVQRVLSKCGAYFDFEDGAAAEDGHKYVRTCSVIIEHMRRMSVDDLEDDGSGTFSDEDSSLSELPLSDIQELTPMAFKDWENSLSASDQIESVPDEDMKDLDM